MVNTERPQGSRAPAPQSSPPLPPLDGDALKQGAGAAAQGLKDQVQDTAGQATAQVKQTVQSLLGGQKDRVTANLGALSDSLRQASEQLRQSEGGAVFASYLDTAATRVQGVSGHLDARDISELFAELESYARQQPAAFLGGMFAIGALAARFLRSTGSGTPAASGAQGMSANAPTHPQQQPPTPPRTPTPGPRTATPQSQPQSSLPRPGTPPPPPAPGVGAGITQPIPPMPPTHTDRLESAYRSDAPAPPMPPMPAAPPAPRPRQHDPKPPQQ